MRIFYLLLLFISFSFARVEDFIAEAEDIKAMLKQSVELYKKEGSAAAKKMSEDAYFQRFENMEGAVGRNIGRKAITMERKFTNLRRMYKENAPLEQVNALVDSLVYDLNEVAPILQKGFKLKAQASDLTYDKEKAALSSIEENKKREAQAEAMIAQMMGISVEELTKEKPDANLGTNLGTNQALNSNENPDLNSVEAELQAAAAMDARLQFILDNISTKFSQSASAFGQNNKEQSKNFLQNALFEDYRNTKAEVLVSKFTQAGNDQKIQQGLRELIRKIAEENLSEKDLREGLEKLEVQLFESFLQIPKEELTVLKIKGFKDENIGRDYSKVAKDIELALGEILQNYEGFSVSIIDDLQNVYLDIFEVSGMESKIGAVDSNLKLKIEALFSKGVALIKASAEKKELELSFKELSELINSSVDKIVDSSPYSLFIWALGIILREGLEALIIIVAIVSYLVQSKNEKRLNIVYNALLSGVVLSFITAFVVAWLFKENSGQSRELIEGVTMLVAVCLLFYVGFWLLSNALNKKWENLIKSETIKAISSNSAKALWLTTFLAVYREGAETVLFYQALLFDSKTSTDYGAVFAGLTLGILVLIVLYYLLKAGAIRLPIKQFFYITSYIIFYMVFVFTGKGFAELIEGKIITPAFLPFNFEPILWLGIYPYYQTLVPQVVVLILLIFGILITKQISKKEKIW